MVERITPRELHERLAAGEPVTVLDVRDRDAFETWHLEGPQVTTVQHPYSQLVAAGARGELADEVRTAFAQRADAAGDVAGASVPVPSEGDPPMTVVCARGEASAQVADLLADAGVPAVNLAGGMDAWAALTVTAQLPAAGEVTAVQVLRPASGCLSYVVVAGGEAAAVDPLAAHADVYARIAAEHEAVLRYVVDTHVHADHVSGVRALAGDHGAPGADALPQDVGGLPAEALLPADARDRGLAYDATSIEDGDTLPLGGDGRAEPAVALAAIHAPGHTSELTAIRVGDLLLSADCLFLDGVGRPDLEAGTAGAPALARTLHETLTERLDPLPDDLTVAPGHVARLDAADDAGRYTATLGALRERLPVFDLDAEAFVERILAEPSPRPANYERLIQVNLGRETVDAAAARELEHGPNNCAVSSVD